MGFNVPGVILYSSSGSLGDILVPLEMIFAAAEVFVQMELY